MKMKRSSAFIVIGGLVSLGLTIAPATKAVTISTNVGVNGTFSVSGTDLINTGQVSFLSLVQNSGTAMVLPAPNQAKGEAPTAACRINLKQFGLAFRLYADEWDGSLPSTQRILQAHLVVRRSCGCAYQEKASAQGGVRLQEVHV